MKVLIADDHPLVRDALARTLRRVLPQCDLLEAGDRAEAEALLRLHRPPLALVDLHMPGMEGAAGVRALCTLAGTTRIAVVSGDGDPAMMRAVFAAGAVGFLPKSDAPAALERALALLLAGGTYTPPQVLADLDGARGRGPARADAVGGTGGAGLTPRQLDVLRCLMRGEPNKLIARELGLTEGTVKIHIAAILRCLQVRNRTEAVVVARRLGIEV
jgi:DNA-binding NarL/FixJ family response regulator